ncbi:hypothetical protein [Cronobacter dublinensis]|uniref:hypothetical protein n=1 Tax=Cronobacter dublinensis TaxID=413497 RepID=UPI00192A6920|nr:hypothetical protein [Cronobacter dublinensis]
MSKENIDYRAIVERIAEMLHGGVTDIGLLTVTVQSYKDRLAKIEAERDALAAENAALKSKGRELLNEACGVYEKYNATINPENGDFMDGQTLHEFQFLMDVETSATDAILREVRASAVDAACLKISKAIASCRQDELIGLDEAVNIASDFAIELRQGGAA